MHYAQLITWRILGYLAPSVAYLKLLEGQHQGKERVLSTREVIHTMRWVPRLTSEKYKPWIMVSHIFYSQQFSSFNYEFDPEQRKKSPIPTLSPLYDLYGRGSSVDQRLLIE